MKTEGIRRQYSREFKMEAVGLVLQGNKPATEIAAELGVGESLLYRWKRDYLAAKDKAFPGTGHLQNTEDERVRALERELRDIKEERDILKKVVRIFSKDPK